MHDLTEHSPKMSKKQKPLTVFNPNSFAVVANEAGQALGGYEYATVHPEDLIAQRTLKKGLLEVRSL